jgi:hypothetical protein
MPAVPSAAAHEAPLPQTPQHDLSHSPAQRTHESPDARARRAKPPRPATDDEILGLDSSSTAADSPAGARHVVPGVDTWHPAAASHSERSAPVSPSVFADSANTPAHAAEESLFDAASAEPAATTSNPAAPNSANNAADPANFRTIFEANPELRQAWDDAQQYRATFSTPEAARAATAQLADLDRMDALFFSRRPEDHAELARAVTSLDPQAFASLAQAIAAQAAEAQRASDRSAGILPALASSDRNAGFQPALASSNENRQQDAGATRIAAQSEFFHAANAAAVESILESIESQVERLLPESVSKSARNRVVGDIYRELDSTLRSNRQLGQQMRDAFRSGSLDSDHQRAVVSLVTGRARQALPAVAKRVLNEWTSTVVAANNDRRARQHAAERRIDISGASGAAGAGRSSPRNINYNRMSDADILNL